MADFFLWVILIGHSVIDQEKKIYQNHVLSFPIYLGNDKEVIIWEMMNDEIKELFQFNNKSIYEDLEK